MSFIELRRNPTVLFLTSVVHQHLLRVLSRPVSRDVIFRIAEELHSTLSPISCTPASVACFGKLAGHETDSYDAICLGSRRLITPEDMSTLGYACVIIEPFVHLSVPNVCYSFRVRIGHRHSKRSGLKCRKGATMGAGNDSVGLGSTHQHPEWTYDN